MQLALEEDKRFNKLTGTEDSWRKKKNKKQKSAGRSRPGVLDAPSDAIRVAPSNSLFKDRDSPAVTQDDTDRALSGARKNDT